MVHEFGTSIQYALDSEGIKTFWIIKPADVELSFFYW